MRKIDLFTEPLDILKDIDCKEMMSNTQLAFICALLKEKKPRKIVEVGVAHGGTTCVILECLKVLAYPVEMHSIDIAEICAFNANQKSGYMIGQVFPKIPPNIDYSLHLGTILPKEIEKIGQDIDFLILDSVHSIPGEILDYITALPFLHEGSVVVLHDILYHQLMDNMRYCCTRVLYDTAVAEKIVCDQVDDGESNIGAFEITGDSYQYIENTFSALALKWEYEPDDEMLADYRKIYLKCYEKKYVEMFDKALLINRKRVKRANTVLHLNNFIENGKKIVLFGAGDYAQRMTKYIEEMGKKVEAYVISDNSDMDSCRIQKNVFHISDLPYSRSECEIIISLHNQAGIKNTVDFRGFKNVFPSNIDDFFDIIMLMQKYE